jgi:hypothetical protein
MPRNRIPRLAAARPLIERALAGAGYDVIEDPAEPNLVQARRGDLGDVVSVVVDAGGRMRFTRVQQLAPEEPSERRLASGRRVRLVRRTDETLTIVRRLTRSDAQEFAELLAELETL